MGSKVYSIVSQGAILAEFAIIPLVQWVVKVLSTQPYGYSLAFYILGGTSAIGALFILALKTHYSWSTPLLK